MDLLIIAFVVILIGFLGAAANEVGVDSRDYSDGAFHREPTGIA